MDFSNLTSNSPEGNRIISSMMHTEEQWRIARNLFMSFINENDFSAWHIHDGWIRYGFKTRNILHNDVLTIKGISDDKPVNKYGVKL